MKKRILFVDDDPNVLQGLQRMLRPMRHEWEMPAVHLHPGRRVKRTVEAPLRSPTLTNSDQTSRRLLWIHLTSLNSSNPIFPPAEAIDAT